MKKVKKVKKSEKREKGGDLKCWKQNFEKYPWPVVTLNVWYTKSPAPTLPQNSFFPSKRAVLSHVLQKKKNKFIKNKMIISRVWGNAISNEMFYISSKMNEISSNKFEIFGELEFLSKMLKILSKVFKNWCEFSIIRRKNTEIYPKKL